MGEFDQNARVFFRGRMALDERRQFQGLAIYFHDQLVQLDMAGQC